MFGQKSVQTPSSKKPVCRGASATVPEEEFIAPFSIPTSIPRFYFAFRKPIQLKREDLEIEGRCDELYNQVRLTFKAAPIFVFI